MSNFSLDTRPRDFDSISYCSSSNLSRSSSINRGSRRVSRYGGDIVSKYNIRNRSLDDRRSASSKFDNESQII